jgi:hypothetical protein
MSDAWTLLAYYCKENIRNPVYMYWAHTNLQIPALIIAIPTSPDDDACAELRTTLPTEIKNELRLWDIDTEVYRERQHYRGR